MEERCGGEWRGVAGRRHVSCVVSGRESARSRRSIGPPGGTARPEPDGNCAARTHARALEAVLYFFFYVIAVFIRCQRTLHGLANNPCISPHNSPRLFFEKARPLFRIKVIFCWRRTAPRGGDAPARARGPAAAGARRRRRVRRHARAVRRVYLLPVNM